MPSTAPPSISPNVPINPPAGPVLESTKERVQSVINLIRPAVQADGGDIELVDVTQAGVVQIRFHGACHGCPSSTMTLHMGIERNLREKVPEVTQVVSVP
jgi:Fe-S cluster biogenesis protein NfuA